MMVIYNTVYIYIYDYEYDDDNDLCYPKIILLN